MKHKNLETKNQVKLQLYEAYLTRQAIPYKKRYTPISGGYCLYVDKANLSRIDGKILLWHYRLPQREEIAPGRTEYYRLGKFYPLTPG